MAAWCGSSRVRREHGAQDVPRGAAARAILEQRPLSDRASGRPHWSLFRVHSEPPFSSSTRVARTKRGRGMFYQILGQMESPTGTLNITFFPTPVHREGSLRD